MNHCFGVHIIEKKLKTKKFITCSIIALPNCTNAKKSVKIDSLSLLPKATNKQKPKKVDISSNKAALS